MTWYIIIAVVVIGAAWYLMKGKKSGGTQPPMQQPPAQQPPAQQPPQM